jgi:hypothetical protein
MVARLVECSDHDVQYGILTVQNVSLEEVQNKIYEIKNKFHDEGFDEWCIDDVFVEFPKEWEWECTQTNYDEAIEI